MFDFAIIGGDLRQKYLCQILLDHGYEIIVCGLYLDFFHPNLRQTASLETAISCSDTIIAPIPLSRNKQTLLQTVFPPDFMRDDSIFNQCADKQKDSFLKSETIFTAADCHKADFAFPISLNKLHSLLTASKTLAAGCIPKQLYTRCRCVDLMESESFALQNGIATAEGIIAEAILNYPGILHQTSCLVLGYGKCAQTLSSRLRGLFANVTVCARSKAALSLACANGMDTVLLENISAVLPHFDLIFNTIPSVILTEPLLQQIRKDAALFDLASYPGGFEQEKATKFDFSFQSCPGLPGKYSPKFCAQAIASCVEGIDSSGIKK